MTKELTIQDVAHSMRHAPDNDRRKKLYRTIIAMRQFDRQKGRSLESRIQGIEMNKYMRHTGAKVPR